LVAQRLGQLVVLGLAHLAAGAVGGQVVGLVEHHQVPGRGFLEPLDARPALQGVHASDQPVVLREGIAAPVRDIALAAKHLEVQVEDLVQLPMPVVHQPGGHHH